MYKNRIIACVITLLQLLLYSSCVSPDIAVKEKAIMYNTFWDWKRACDQLPMKILYSGQKYSTVLTAQEYQNIIKKFFSVLELSSLSNRSSWVEPYSDHFFNNNTQLFEPYVQKLEVPINAKVAFHGDLHGDIHSLNEYISGLVKRGYLDAKNPFHIKNSDFYMIFLGDYTDRGWYGAEVIYTILRLKIANPERVFMVRGNHEDRYLNERYGFTNELQIKFHEAAPTLLSDIYRIYNYLPVALYCGAGSDKKNFLLCCHGGIELGFQPQPLLQHDSPIAYMPLGGLYRSKTVKQLSPQVQHALEEEVPTRLLEDMMPIEPTSPSLLGFMWYDFVVSKEAIVAYSYGRDLMLGYMLTQELLQLHSSDTHRLVGIFRAHQHTMDLANVMMKRILNTDHISDNADVGVGKLWIDNVHKRAPEKLWHGIVCTFLLSPGCYGKGVGFDYDAFGILHMADQFSDWRLQMIQQTIF